MAACRSQGGRCRIAVRLGNQLRSRSGTARRTHSHGPVRSARRFTARRYGVLMSWQLLRITSDRSHQSAGGPEGLPHEKPVKTFVSECIGRFFDP